MHGNIPDIPDGCGGCKELTGNFLLIMASTALIIISHDYGLNFRILLLIISLQHIIMAPSSTQDS